MNNTLIATALRGYATLLMNDPEHVPPEEGRSLDRALRSCAGISDIDGIWVRWSYIAEKHGWLTEDELVFKNGKYRYPASRTINEED